MSLGVLFHRADMKLICVVWYNIRRFVTFLNMSSSVHWRCIEKRSVETVTSSNVERMLYEDNNRSLIAKSASHPVLDKYACSFMAFVCKFFVNRIVVLTWVLAALH